MEWSQDKRGVWSLTVQKNPVASLIPTGRCLDPERYEGGFVSEINGRFKDTARHGVDFKDYESRMVAMENWAKEHAIPQINKERAELYRRLMNSRSQHDKDQDRER